MTIGTDQLDQWTKTLAEADMLYREIQLLVRINPEAYRAESDAITVVGVANADATDDGDMLHPIVFAKRWAWHLAGEARTIPPLTNKWAPLAHYVSANLQYLARDEREAFAGDLKRVRGMLGALVNENGLARGEEDALSALNAHAARKALRQWALTSDHTMTRKDLSAAFPTLTDREWTRLRVRKHRSTEGIPAGHYPVRWAAEIAPEDGGSIDAVPEPPYRDMLSHHGDRVSLDELRDKERAVDWAEGDDESAV